jgi:hypothetical protein
MCHRFIGGAVLAAAAVLAGPTAGRAQDSGGFEGGGLANSSLLVARGQAEADIGGLDPPLNTCPTIPIPTGQAGNAGFYTSAEYVMLTQSRDIGKQIVAFRGLVDSTGRITGLPGTYIGSGKAGLTTDDFARSGYSPGFEFEVGYRFDDGTRLFANYLHIFDHHYKTGASLVPPFFRSAPNLADTFLVSLVYNFPPFFAGPISKTGFDQGPGNPGLNTYGLWNGATVMTMQYTQRYTQSEIGARVPLFQTDYSRVYGIAAGKFAWLFDRFQWYTMDTDFFGVSNPQDQAWYTNTLSQRMYGPVVGCGHEIFLCNQFSLSCDLTGGLLLSVVKERVKYKLESPGNGGTIQPIASKASYDTWQLVPNANANLNLWWYPTEGVQLRVGYQALTYFNTTRMQEPVGFNYATPDPRYETQVFRILHGFNVGVALFF